MTTDQDPHPPQGVRSPAPRPVGERDRRDREAHRRAVAGPIPLPTKINKYTRAALAARRQEVARAVRDPHAQAPARHPRADAADARRADEARPVGRRRRRDQVLSEPEASDHGKIDVFNLKREEGRQSRPRRRRLRRRGEGAPLLRGGEGAAARRAAPARSRPRRAPRSAAAARSCTSRRAPATRARARSARRTSSAAARRSARKPRDYAYRPPRKVQQRRARARALSLRAKEKKLVVVDEFELDDVKTKRLAGVAQGARAPSKALVVDAQEQREPALVGAATCRSRQCLPPEGVNVYDILRHDDASSLTAGRREGARGARCRPSRQLRNAMRSPEQIIKRPLLTEKSTRLGDRRRVRRRRGRVATSQVCSRSRATRTRSRSATRSRSCSRSRSSTSARSSCAARMKRMGRVHRPSVRTGRRRSSPSKPGDKIEFFEGV